ncbi:MAG: DUF481 domain-containing protein, partial [Candidatus Binatia bacterium]
VKVISPAGVEFQPDFANGPMLVPWDNVEELSTEGSFQVLYGEDQEATAPVSAYRDGHLQVGEVSVEPGDLVSVVALANGEPGFGDRMRSAWRYWHGGVDVGVNVQQATTDNFGALFAVRALRSAGPTRLALAADYRYATQRDPDNAPPRKKRTVDAASALVRGEYDLTKNVYLYASTDALYDAVQNLSLRAIPKAGAGYVLWQREPAEGKRDFLQVEAGAGWVYEKYIDNGTLPGPIQDENDYFTVAFGAAASVLLPRGAAFDWRFDYLPSVSDFTGDYVIRTVAGLTVPLIAPISARLSVADTYDSTPSAGAEENSLLVDTTLSVVW